MQLRAARSETMISRIEVVALRLFEERGFDAVTVEDIASKAQISVRTFYRCFPAKEDVLQVQIDRRSKALQAALSARPVDEPPLHSVSLAYEQVVSAEDQVFLRCWTNVVEATPSVLRTVVGGIQLKSGRVIGDFLAVRLGLPSDALVPTTLAAAVGGVIQAAHTRWFCEGGDLATWLSESFAVLERELGSGPKPGKPASHTDTSGAT
jgi:AcrR family transcriptional regulator